MMSRNNVHESMGFNDRGSNKFLSWTTMVLLLASLVALPAQAQFTPTPDTPIPTVIATQTGSTFKTILAVMISLVVIAVVLAILACVYVKGQRGGVRGSIRSKPKANNSNNSSMTSNQNNQSSNINNTTVNNASSNNGSSFVSVQTPLVNGNNNSNNNSQGGIEMQEITKQQQLQAQQQQLHQFQPAGDQQELGESEEEEPEEQHPGEQQPGQPQVLPPVAPQPSLLSFPNKKTNLGSPKPAPAEGSGGEGTAGDSLVSANGISLGGIGSKRYPTSSTKPIIQLGMSSGVFTSAKEGTSGVPPPPRTQTGGGSGSALLGNNNSIGGHSAGARSGYTSSIMDNTILFNENDEADNERRKIIASRQYQKMKMIGRGAFGSVYSVLLVTGQSIAVKEMNLSVDDGDVYTEALCAVDKEMEVMRTIDHPNVVRYYSAELDQPNNMVRVFMELITGGSLGSMARSMKNPLAEMVVQRFMFQAVSGLAYVHSKGIVHRDLKGDNILLSTSGTVKLADFGTATQVGANTRGAQTMLGTPYFMAPELLVERDGEIGYGTKADVWSLGITVGELMDCGKPPWPFFTNPGQAFIHIATEDSLPLVPDHCSPLCRSFILFACQRDPTIRPTSSELLQHPWLSGLEMDESQFDRTDRSNVSTTNA